MTETFHFGTGGFDLRFKLPALTSGQWLKVAWNSAIVSGDLNLSSPSASLELKRTDTGYTLSLKNTAGGLVDRFSCALPAGQAACRVIVRNVMISVMIGDDWAHSFILRSVSHAEKPEIYLSASGVFTIQDVLLVELADGHDDVTIDIENNVENAIASVINNRPITIWSRYDGSINYAYEVPRAEIWSYVAKSIGLTWQLPIQAGSDLIVFHTNTAVFSDVELLRKRGFFTRVHKYPNLEAAAIRAGRKLQSLGKTDLERAAIASPFLPQIELYDVVHLQATVSGGQHAVDKWILVDDLKISSKGNMRYAGGIE